MIFSTSVKCRRLGEFVGNVSAIVEVKVLFYAWYPSNRYFTTEGHNVSKNVSRYYIYPRNAPFCISEILGKTAAKYKYTRRLSNGGSGLHVYLV